MVHRQPSRPTAAPTERRSGRDRRQVEKGPPGSRDRRVGLEPRRPEVVELEVSVSEWLALQAAMASTSPASPAGAAAGAAVGNATALPGRAGVAAAPAPAQPVEPTRAPGTGRVR